MCRERCGEFLRECRSAVLLEGRSESVEQGVAPGCSFSSILFSVFINGLLVAVEQAELGIELSDEDCCLQMILWELVSLGNSCRGL